MRQEKILELLQKNELMSVEELAVVLNVSPMTVRRDLNTLQDKNLVQRTFGAAYLKKRVLGELEYDEKRSLMVIEKKRIAQKAVDLISEGDSILLDAGTTTLEIANLLAGFNSLKVLTNDLKIALILSKNKGITTYIAGGIAASKTASCNDSLTIEFLRKFNVDISFIGCNAFSAESGASTPSMEKAYTKRIMIEVAEKAFLVADNSKYGERSFSKLAVLSDFSGIITSEPFSDIEKQRHEQLGYNFIYV